MFLDLHDVSDDTFYFADLNWMMQPEGERDIITHQNTKASMYFVLCLTFLDLNI